MRLTSLPLHQLATAVLSLVVTLTLPATAPAQTIITVDDNRPGAVINPGIFGSNLQWENNGDGMLLHDNWAPGALTKVLELGLTNLRFPGGDLSNTYRWQNGIGPRHARPPGISYDGATKPSNFGTDELLALCKATNAEPLLTVNAQISAGEAADWVSYVNAGTVGAGAPGCKATYWEIGNEPYNPLQPSLSTAAEYARRYLEFRRVMKARDPSIKVGLALEASFTQAKWIGNEFPHMTTWNDDVMRVVGREVDFVSLHFYAPLDGGRPNDEMHQRVMAGPMVFEQNLKIVREQLAPYGLRDMEIVVSEYGPTFGDRNVVSDRISSTESALFNASMLFSFARDGRISRANHWSFANNSHFGTVWLGGPTPLERPSFHAFRMLRWFAGRQILPMATVNPQGYALSPAGNLPHLPNVPMIDALAATDAFGGMLVALVNRSPNSSQNVILNLQKLHTKLASWQLEAGGVAARAWRAFGQAQMVGDGKLWAIQVPPASLTLVLLWSPPFGGQSDGKLQLTTPPLLLQPPVLPPLTSAMETPANG